MEGNRYPLALWELAIAVQATEAARFAILLRGGIPEQMGAVVEHLRPDDSSEETRASAVRAFRDIIEPCFRQGKDGAIWLVDGHCEPHQFCLVLHRRWSGEVDELLAFIVHCADQAAARNQLMRLQVFEAARNQR